jgi:hypothetical protein
MVIDYRGVNKLTQRNQHPLPRTDELLDQLSGAQVFSSLHLMSDYHQVRMTEEDIPKTVFRAPQGLFQSPVLLFGLTNATAVFQKVMNDVLGPLIGKCVLMYLDDILVYLDDILVYLDDILVYLDDILVYLDDILVYLDDILVYLDDILVYLDDILVYLDDILVYSQNVADHDQHFALCVAVVARIPVVLQVEKVFPFCLIF